MDPLEKIKVHSTAASTKWTAQICSTIYLQLANIVIKFSLAINTGAQRKWLVGLLQASHFLNTLHWLLSVC